MKNKWIWFGAFASIIFIVVAISKFSGSSNDALNADGIRDDVAVAIQQAFPESEIVRAAATQVARTIQLSIDDPKNALEIRRRGEAATECWYAVRGDVSENENTSLVLKVEAMVVNSYQRSRAYIRYNSKLSGQIFDSIQPDFSSCEFDVASMGQ